MSFPPTPPPCKAARTDFPRARRVGRSAGSGAAALQGAAGIKNEPSDLRPLNPANGREPYQPRPQARCAGREGGVPDREMVLEG